MQSRLMGFGRRYRRQSALAAALVATVVALVPLVRPARAADERLFPDGTGTTTETKPSTCAGLQLIITTTRLDGGVQMIVTQNFNGIQGLSQTQFITGAGTSTNYSYPAWLMAAYNNDTATIQIELETNRLTNRLEGNAACPPYVPTPVPGPAVVVPACTTVPPYTVNVRHETGDLVTTTYNYNYVEGLTRIVVQYNDITATSYGIPGWLLAAYGNNADAVIAEVESGRLMNRRATPC